MSTATAIIALFAAGLVGWLLAAGLAVRLTRTRRQLDLDERDALARRAVDALRVIIWAADGDEVLRVSRGGALRTLGLRSGQLVGTRIGAVEERGNLATDDEDELSIIRRVFRTGRRDVRTNRHDGPEGTQLYLRMEYAPLFDAEGRVEYVCGCGVDVTDEERRARRTHDEAIAEAAARLVRPTVAASATTAASATAGDGSL